MYEKLAKLNDRANRNDPLTLGDHFSATLQSRVRDLECHKIWILNSAPTTAQCHTASIAHKVPANSFTAGCILLCTLHIQFDTFLSLLIKRSVVQGTIIQRREVRRPKRQLTLLVQYELGKQGCDAAGQALSLSRIRPFLFHAANSGETKVPGSTYRFRPI
jgi:hypothetical protein